MKKLYFKCQPILPMSFSDSVSYYETLCQLTKKLNETIEQSNENTAKIKNIFETQGLFVPIASTENVGGIYGSTIPSIDWEEYALSPIFVDESGNASALYQKMNVATTTKIGGIKVNSEPNDGIEGIIYLNDNNFARCKTILPIASTGRRGVIRLGEEPEEGIETPVYSGDHGVAFVKYTIPIADSETIGGIKSQEYNRTGAICNVHVDENGLATVKVPSFTIDDITSIPVATDIKVGGIKSQEHLEASGTEYPVHVALTGYASVKIPTSGYVLPQATAITLGGIKAEAKTILETVEAKIDSVSGKLYVPAGQQYTLPQATASALGGVKADTKTSAETVEVKIDGSTGKLYVPSGSYTLPASTTSELGGVKVTATDASKTKLPVSIDSNDIIHAELGAATTSAFGGFKLVTGYSEVGNTHYVNVDGQGNAYVKVPSGGGGGSTVYRHDIEVTHYSDVAMYGYKYIKLNFVLYNSSSALITGSSSALLDAIFCGGYANADRTSVYGTSTVFYNRVYNSGSSQYLSSSMGLFGFNAADLTVGDTVTAL